MRTIRLLLEYDGGAFAGWQIQPDEKTVQGELTRHLRTLLRQEVRVIGAGRTDAGCHALGQVASFRVEACPLPLERLQRSLNALLAGEAAVLSVEDAAPGFHALRSARRRHYFYLIATRPSPLCARRAWLVTAPMDTDVLSRAAASLAGNHDFAAFAAAGSAPRGTRCEVCRARWSRWRLGLRFDIEANRFLRKMVRGLVGTMIEIGRGRLPEDRIAELLEEPSRDRTGVTAPAHGLYLADVLY
jgi:tRNA pseudouridine38-40 synthase